MTLSELKNLYGLCVGEIAAWAEQRGAELDYVIRDARTRDGDVAMEILEAVPSTSFSQHQLDELFANLTHWIQGPSKLYEQALRVMVKHARVLEGRLEVGFKQACARGDDSLVRGFCHVFWMSDYDLQYPLKKHIAESLALSNPCVREVINDLVARSRIFDPEKKEDDRKRIRSGGMG